MCVCVRFRTCLGKGCVTQPPGFAISQQIITSMIYCSGPPTPTRSPPQPSQLHLCLSSSPIPPCLSPTNACKPSHRAAAQSHTPLPSITRSRSPFPHVRTCPLAAGPHARGTTPPARAPPPLAAAPLLLRPCCPPGHRR